MAEIHVALSLMVLITPLMKPFIAAYVDENGLAYTNDVPYSRSPHSSRSRTMKGISKPRDPYASTEEEPLRCPRAIKLENRTMRNMRFSVDRDTLELSERRQRGLWNRRYVLYAGRNIVINSRISGNPKQLKKPRRYLYIEAQKDNSKVKNSGSKELERSFLEI